MTKLKLVALFFAFAPIPAHAVTCGQLAAVKGPNVEILRRQSQRSGETVRYAIRIEENKVTPLECDDVVLAGKDSSAKILLSDSKLSLGPESRIELASHTGSGSEAGNVNLINLTYGKLRALIHRAGGTKPQPQAKGDQTSFRVRTYSAVVGVRGTDFYTHYEPNSGLTEQATIEGVVEVQQAGTKQKVVVNAGNEVRVEVAPGAAATAGELPAPKQEPAKSVKPLKVVPIREEMKNAVRSASLVVKEDADFASKKAVETLGKPETWTIERESVPDKLKDIKNEF